MGETNVSAAKLKALWEAGRVDPLPLKELAIFTQAPTHTVTDVCSKMAQSGLSDVAIATACKQLCGVSHEMSNENAAAFASSLLLPQVLGLKGNASSTLAPALTMFAGKYAGQITEAVLVPCALSGNLGNHQSNLVLQVLKTVSPEQRKTFLRMFLSGGSPWGEATCSLLLKVLDLKVDMEGELVSMLVSALTSHGSGQMNGLQFVKITIAIISKYGKQLTTAHIAQLGEILQNNETMLKKTALAALSKLTTQHG